jgi:hypothetical protein
MVTEMTEPPVSERDALGPWLVLKADKGDLEVFAMCVQGGLAQNLQKKGDVVFSETRAVVEIMHKPQGSTDSPGGTWRAWIAWRGHARIVDLDRAEICSGCGLRVVNAGVSPEGLILVEH